MTCESLTDIMLDMARGAAVPAAARVSAERHMAACPQCAAEYARQRALTAGLQTLAAAAQEWAPPAGLEERLLAAMAARERDALPDRARARAPAWRYSLAAAAVLTIAVWAGVRGVQTIYRLKAEAARSETGEPGNRPTGEPKPSERLNGGTGDERARDPQPATPRPTSLRPATGESATRAPRPRGPATRKAATRDAATRAPATPRPRDVSPVEFVSIPSAIGLPALESGTVVRMELPLGALPQYGLEIAPDAMRSSIEADVLVGQDGQPRAIRLVGLPDAVAQDSRSRR